MIKKYNEFNTSESEQNLDNVLGFSEFITEDAEYYISKDGSEAKVSKSDFIKIGADKNFQPKLNGERGFSVKKTGDKIVANIDESKTENK